MHDRTLVLLRHAKSDWSGGEVDERRPLAKRGRRQAPEAGRWLARSVGAIDLALVSPAERARATWELASAELNESPETRIEDRLYEAWGRALMEVVNGLPDELRTVVLVGHNPGLAELASTLTTQPVLMPTSGLAVLSLHGSWSMVRPSTAVLTASGRPPTTA